MTNTDKIQANNAELLECIEIAENLPDFIEPSGIKEITENGDYDITEYKIASVNVPIPEGYIKPSGTKEITENGTHNVREFESVNVAVKSGDVFDDEDFLATGDCSYKFSASWNNFLIKYKDRIRTENITNGAYMFNYSTVENIPFDINMSQTSGCSLQYMFSNCRQLQTVSKITGYCANCQGLFYNCYLLREMPNDFADDLLGKLNTTQSGMFQYCYSLRAISITLLSKCSPLTSYVSSYFYSGFYYCATLDELSNLPIPYIADNTSWIGNAFNRTVGYCSRLKNFTFETLDGMPYVVRWKSQTIDLSEHVGYSSDENSIIGYNSGITSAKRVSGDESYQLLKNDPDWYTNDVNYSRYNHDSAVNTINSLPDTSAYLATAGGTNTIKFTGNAGLYTDGGAINTLTAEEIAVATAKGWTVTFA